MSNTTSAGAATPPTGHTEAASTEAAYLQAMRHHGEYTVTVYEMNVYSVTVQAGSLREAHDEALRLHHEHGAEFDYQEIEELYIGWDAGGSTYGFRGSIAPLDKDEDLLADLEAL